ncbi:hypothetical protein [Streptomyces sp. HC307]|uniref:DUF7848 domain-containing protein n=1 Tax=Streptomyces flavusporus TaxID=3385496 RepID=UPI00391755EA
MVEQFETGTFVCDPRSDRVGEYRGKAGPYAMLRPVGGGREWQADPARIRTATPEERLSANVRAANHRSGNGVSEARPPVPVPGCGSCAELAALREEARARSDGSLETDADVLLRRHQAQAHPEGVRRRVFRYVPYSMFQEPSAEPEYEAWCVSGEEADCGARSGPRLDPAEVEEWQRRHTQETHHARYRRSFVDYAVLERQ